MLGRSRGAVINACKRLTDLDQATRTKQVPQRYQATPQGQPAAAGSEPNTDTG